MVKNFAVSRARSRQDTQCCAFDARQSGYSRFLSSEQRAVSPCNIFSYSAKANGASITAVFIYLCGDQQLLRGQNPSFQTQAVVLVSGYQLGHS